MFNMYLIFKNPNHDVLLNSLFPVFIQNGADHSDKAEDKAEDKSEKKAEDKAEDKAEEKHKNGTGMFIKQYYGKMIFF